MVYVPIVIVRMYLIIKYLSKKVKHSNILYYSIIVRLIRKKF